MNLDLLIEISDLEVNMEQRLLFTDDLKKLHLEKEELSKQQKQLTSTYQTELKDLKRQLARLELYLNKINGQITATERTLGYLNKLENPDPKTRAQSIELTEKLIKLKEERETTISSQHEISKLISKSEFTYNESMQKIEKNFNRLNLQLSTVKKI